jgi:hypothetical protein
MARLVGDGTDDKSIVLSRIERAQKFRRLVNGSTTSAPRDRSSRYKLTSSPICLVIAFSIRIFSESPDSVWTKVFSTTSQSSL